MIKIFEMFAGYGGASFALKKAGIEFECVGYSEIDKYAIQCFEQNHKGKNFGDCTKINPDDIPDFDLLTGGFPCPTFSIAGKGLGEKDPRGTLFHEIIRIAEVKKPKYMLLENVKGLTFKNHRETFLKILSELRRVGYNVKYKVLNTKEHGVPQNRERIFFFCFRDKEEWRNFKLPAKVPLTIFLKDILEDEVDEKYYLNNEQVERLIKNFRSYNERMCKKETAPTLCARDFKDPNHNKLRLLEPKIVEPFIVASRSYPRTGFKEVDGERKQQLEPRHDGASNTISTIQKDNYVCIINATKKGYQEAIQGDGINLEQPNSKTRRGRVQEQISSTLQTNDQRGVITKDFRIRKLTPKECFRLMGFLNDEINLEGLSNTQQYKLAGNGWDINLVSKIFKQMLK